MAIHNDLGAWGERAIAQHLGQVGQVQRGQAADLRLAGVEIEVKTARPTCYNGNTPGYQFCLHRAGRRGLRAPVVVCVCLNPRSLEVATFVLPARVVAEQRMVKIPLDVEGYAGRWAEYRDAWHLLAEAMG